MAQISFGKPPRRGAAVTYRCTLPSGREGSVDLWLRPELATLSDAWTRLRGRFGDFDPTTIEIEIRPVARMRIIAGGAPADPRRSPSVPCW